MSVSRPLARGPGAGKMGPRVGAHCPSAEEITMRRRPLGYATLLVLAVAPAAAGAEPMPRFQVPPGFVVERVAGPPLVRYPLFAALDDRGRLYVAEGTGTNLPGAELAKRRLGRILLLEDTDGDGVFDVSKDFADQLV